MADRTIELRYLLGAVPARLATEGTRVALALTAAERLHSIETGALLIAVLTAPSVIAAPVVGALLDAVRSPRATLLAGAVVLAAAIGVTALLGAVPLAVVVVALLVGGIVLPAFGGGTSGFVADLMPEDRARGFAVDALSYNIAGIGGPALVAVVAALASPTVSLIVLAVLALAGGALLAALPLTARGASARPSALARAMGSGLAAMVRRGPLLRGTLAGTLSQVGAGATPIVAVELAVLAGAGVAAGPLLLTASAIGGLVGALVAGLGGVARALGSRPAALVMGAGLAATGLLTAAAAVLPLLGWQLAAFALAGVPIAPTVAAMFRIRTDSSPAAVRAQVFTVGSGLRVAAAALGAALIAPLAHADARLLVVLVAVPWVLSAVVLVPDSRRDAAATVDA